MFENRMPKICGEFDKFKDYALRSTFAIMSTIYPLATDRASWEADLYIIDCSHCQIRAWLPITGG